MSAKGCSDCREHRGRVAAACWSSVVLVLVSLVVIANPVLGQRLSIIKEGPSQCSVVGSAPPENRYALQATKDLKLWLDLNDTVSGAVSNRLGIAEATQRYFRLTPWVESPPIRIVLLGDS